MRLIELLDALNPALRLSDGRQTCTAAELGAKVFSDSRDYTSDSKNGHLRIYRMRNDGVRRKVYDEMTDGAHVGGR